MSLLKKQKTIRNLKSQFIIISNSIILPSNNKNIIFNANKMKLVIIFLLSFGIGVFLFEINDESFQV
jgi:hypothetical protein